MVESVGRSVGLESGEVAEDEDGRSEQAGWDLAQQPARRGRDGFSRSVPELKPSGPSLKPGPGAYTVYFYDFIRRSIAYKFGICQGVNTYVRCGMCVRTNDKWRHMYGTSRSLYTGDRGGSGSESGEMPNLGYTAKRTAFHREFVNRDHFKYAMICIDDSNFTPSHYDR